MSNKPSRVIFVGNIPYGVPEEQLIDIFKEAGPVVTFRMMFDRETGKPKGFGFCEFQDVETAMCAVRNLNNYELNGRQLKVNFAEYESAAERDQGQRSRPSHSATGGGSGGQSSSREQAHQQQTTQQAPIPSFSIGAQAAPSMDTINATLASMTSNQLLEVLTHFKGLLGTNPDQAKKILFANPQLSYALLQALLMMGLVDTNVVQKLVQNFSAQPSTAPTIPTVPQPNQHKPTAAASLEAIPEAQRTLLYQIMQMSQEQIDALPTDQRQQVLMIKAQIENQKLTV